MSLFDESEGHITYNKESSIEKFESLELKIERLKNLDQTIDQVFDYLSAVGKPDLLEKLCPYFGVVWPSARALTAFISKIPTKQFEGKSILEIGCGLAIPSLSLAKRGIPVTATDYHPEVPRFLAANILNNQLKEETLRYTEHNWEAGELLGGQTWELILGSDLLYEARYAETLAVRIAALLQKSPTSSAIIADPGRPYLQNFTDAMARLGLESHLDILSAVEIGNPKPKEIFILSFRWKNLSTQSP